MLLVKQQAESTVLQTEESMWPGEEGLNHVIGGGSESKNQKTKAFLCSPEELEFHPSVPEGSSTGNCQEGKAGSNKIEQRGRGRRENRVVVTQR